MWLKEIKGLRFKGQIYFNKKKTNKKKNCFVFHLPCLSLLTSILFYFIVFGFAYNIISLIEMLDVDNS
jgi:uncharacterized membrane protein (UPF0182 family)